MIETAMLKVFTTERLWEVINDAFQIYGGSAYFVDLPLERMLRDARINQIGEGSNEVLTSFIALVGMRGPGMEFKEIYDTVMKPSRDRMGKAWAAGMNRLGAAMDLFASTCVLSRWDAELQFARRNGDSPPADHAAADLFLRQSFRRIRRFLGDLTDNDDKSVLATAKSFLGKSPS